jgi:NAD(P)-dependent dehydrogenase (short-subunit alcohol dehydrogenase family)
MSTILAGKTAFIPGGSGGLGRSCAKFLLQDGANVVLMARRADALERARATLLDDVPGGRVEVHVGDGDSVDDIRAGLDKACKITGRIDIMIPMVGGGGFMPILMHDVDSFRRQIDLNLTTAFIPIRYGVPLMTQGGSIVCISSTAAVTPFPWLSAYCAGKAALEHLVRTAADELSGAKVRVNCVRPGMTKTDGTTPMFEAPSVINRFLEQIPLGRAGHPDDIGRAIRYLAGPESDWVTGQSFAVDGGHELRRNPDLTDMVRGMFGSGKIDKVLKGQEAS